jgi:hypothetical protein
MSDSQLIQHRHQQHNQHADHHERFYLEQFQVDLID